MPVNKPDNIPEHYDKKLKECFLPTEVIMAALCNRWSLKVLFALEEADDKPMRFGEIRKASKSTSDKMMDQALKSLKDYKLILFNEKIQPGGYTLTDRGRSLLEVLHGLEIWVDEHKRDFARELLKKQEEEKRKSPKPKRIRKPYKYDIDMPAGID